MDLIGIELYLNLGTGSKYKNNLMIRNKRSVAFYFVNNLLYNIVIFHYNINFI